MVLAALEEGLVVGVIGGGGGGVGVLGDVQLFGRHEDCGEVRRFEGDTVGIFDASIIVVYEENNWLQEDICHPSTSCRKTWW